MSDLVLGVKLEGSNASLVNAVKESRNEFEALRKQTDAVAASSSKMASGYSGMTSAVKEHGAAVTTTAGNVSKLLDRYDPMGAKLRQLQEDFKALDRAAAGGKIAGLDDSRVDQVYANLQAQIKATSAAANGYATATSNAARSAGQLRQANQQLPMQFTDIWVSLAAGQNPLTVLLQQGTQIKDSFGGVGNAAKAMGGYVMGLINPVTLAAAAAAAAGYAWYTWGNQAEEAATKALNASKSLRDSAESGISFTLEEKMRELYTKRYEAQEKFRQREKEMGDRFSVDEAVNLKAAVKAYERQIADLKMKLEEQAARDAKKNKPKEDKVDPNETAVIQMENELYRKRLELIGKTNDEIKVSELVRNGATVGQIERANAAAEDITITNEKIAADKALAKEIDAVNKQLDNADPMIKATKEWELLTRAMERGQITQEQAGKIYADVVGKNEKAAKEMSDTWKTFADNTQRTLSDVLLNGMNGKFNDIEDMFKQMLFRMAANAAAANITGALFGSGKGDDKGLIGALISGFTGSGKVNANGNAFGSGDALAFANGGAFTNQMYNSPTAFKFASGSGFGLGVMGEAGPEAVMPLSRGSDGKLGVRSQGGGGVVVHFTDNSQIHIDARADRAQALQEAGNLIDQKQAKLVDTLRRQKAIA